MKHFSSFGRRLFISTELLDTRVDTFYTASDMIECELAIEIQTKGGLGDIPKEDERVRKGVEIILKLVVVEEAYNLPTT